MRFVSRGGGLCAADLPTRVVARGSTEFPRLLDHLADPPDRLWVAGRDLASLPPCVAIVGSRTPTRYGEDIARGLAADLAQAGLCIVSGMARGIDSWAHRGALEAGTTVAVLPGGVDRCYPSSNKELYERIADEGILVAEVPPGTPTHKHRFTHRNRIIAALSLAVVVVQAAEHSGALATARHALDIGRDVFAVPGDVRVDVSVGVHALLGEGAGVCTGARDVLERIAPELSRSAASTTFDPIPETLPQAQADILSALAGEVLSVDSIALRVGLSRAPLLVAITKLELAGWIASAPGGAFHRVR
ncbi:MAG: DNA-processing protein DprA [Actinomycetota bacterium]